MIHRIKLLDLKSLDLGRLKYMVQMDNFCPFASVFMMGEPAFFPKIP